MALILRANTELVAVAWIATIPGIDPAQVATTLPAPDAATDNLSWAASGFVQIVTGVGGSPHRYNPLREPVVQIDCWAAASPSSTKVPWGKANHLAETIVAALYDEDLMRQRLTLPGIYPDASVFEAYALTEPRRIPGDPSNYAHYTLDLALSWVELPPA